MSNIEHALTDAITYLVANGDRTPYPDDPRWSPWTRFQKPLIDRLAAARDQHRGAVEALERIADPPMGDDYSAPREYAEWLRNQARAALANLRGQ